MLPVLDLKAVNIITFAYCCISLFQHVNGQKRIINCDVIIGGGSAASLGAAITAARKGLGLGYTVCLTEPSDWLGGQLTSSAVSAIDFGQWNRNWWFQSKTFQDMMESLGPGNPGRCWVSTKCYLPRDLLNNYINKIINSLPNLRVFYNTVIKSVQSIGNIIESVSAVQRFERVTFSQWTYLLSETIHDWYSLNDSALFTKQVLTFTRITKGTPVIIDGTEFGDILVLSNAAFRQGVEVPTEDSSTVNDICSQRFTIPFYIKYEQNPSDFDQTPLKHYGSYSLDNKHWGRVWSYRRSHSTSGGAFHEAHKDEVSNQNWSHGNDFYDKPLFLTVQETNKEISDWKGGVDIIALQLAESRAYGWYHFFKENSNSSIKNYLKLARTDIVGTETGLSKLPYIRDTRRSIGLTGFVLKKSDTDKPYCHGTFEKQSPAIQRPLNCSEYSTRFHDSIALGNYVADVHGVSGCSWPAYINNYYILPFHIPFRALTNQQYENLLVAGKTMAQTFMANAATRTHPTEFATGEAAGSAAIMMLRKSFTASDMYQNVDQLQKELIKESPIYWDQPRATQSPAIVG